MTGLMDLTESRLLPELVHCPVCQYQAPLVGGPLMFCPNTIGRPLRERTPLEPGPRSAPFIFEAHGSMPTVAR